MIEEGKDIGERLYNEAKQLTKIRDKRKTIKEAEELASCTFRPKINQTNATKIDKSRARASIDTVTKKAKRA